MVIHNIFLCIAYRNSLVNARLKFVDMYKDKPPTLWSDETKIELFVRNLRVDKCLLSIDHADLYGEWFY